MQYLLVIDMQEDYVGAGRNRKAYPYDEKLLIDTVNERIREYPTDAVIYITNKFFWESGREQNKLVKGLKVVSSQVYEKRKSSCFSNKKLLEYLKKNNATSLELVGVDGNYCVGSSALEGIKKGFEVLFNESCVGVGKKKKFVKVKRKLEKSGVQFI